MTRHFDNSPTHIVIGATDVAATQAFFAAFGFVLDGPAMVRGLGHRTELIIEPAPAGRRLVAYDLGPRGLDLYTADLDRSIDVAAATGAEVGPVVTVEIGPMIMRQVTVWGPDDIPLVLIENPSRRASLLDEHHDELHSEIHSLVWAVPSRDDDSRWWFEAGLTKGIDLAFDDPAVATFMCLPDPQVAVAMTMLANEANDPIRFEVLEFTGRTGASFADDGSAGIQAIGFTVAGAGPDRFTTPGGVVVDIRGR